MLVSLAQHLEGPARPATVRVGGPRGGPPLSTVLRRDNWRLQPVLVALGLLGFVAYVVWAANRNGAFYAGSVGRDYLSPLYSPCITHSCISSGYVWGGWSWWRVSPAWLILIFPGAFRATCYYYRKAYYRAIWRAPQACGVAEPHRRYTGETRFPLILQNLHRLFFILALLVNGVLTWDAFESFRWPGGWNMGVGSIILTLNAALLWMYSLSCHSCRHIIGGRLKHFSRHPVRFWLWGVVSKLNQSHMQIALVSMVWVALTDLYIRMVAVGWIPNPRFF